MRPVLFLLALFAASGAIARYTGPAVEACRALAITEIGRDAARLKTVEFDRDLDLEPYARKAGSQTVASLLMGSGAIVYAAGPAVEMSFVCLLADEKRAVFFHWLPRRDAPALAQCRRGGQDAGECLELLLQVAERDLTELYARHYVEARDADVKAGNESASNAFRRSAEGWRGYRDAECARRPEGAPRKACLVDLTRRRMLDLR